MKVFLKFICVLFAFQVHISFSQNLTQKNDRQLNLPPGLTLYPKTDVNIDYSYKLNETPDFNRVDKTVRDFKETLNVTCSIEDSGDISYVNTSIAAFNPVNNEIRLISVDEKTVFVLISTNGIVDQSRYSKSEEVNAHFLKTDGIVECSYSWNNNNMKLVLDKTNAKKILINTFGFESTLISNLF